MLVNNLLTLHIDELSERQWRKLFRSVRFSNGEQIIEPWKVIPKHSLVQFPRGAWSLIPDKVEYIDERVFPERRLLNFIPELDPVVDGKSLFEGQRNAVDRIISQEQGIVVRPPGTGKTNIVLAALAEIPTNALVLVHTTDILDQWLERIANDMPDCDAGIIQGSKFHIGDITVSTVQTFHRRLAKDPTLAFQFGAVVLDEAHHAAASTFEQVLNEMQSRYRIGVTATKRRADRMHPYMQIVLGPIIHNMKFTSKVPVEVIPIKRHEFKYKMRGPWDYRGMLDALISDDRRNKVIATTADRMIQRGHSVLVLSREIEHLNRIMLEMQEDAQLLIGTGMTKAQRKLVLEKFREGEIKCVLATQLADEALDVPVLSCVILTFPGKHDGRIIQQVGRALREHPLKSKAVIVDIVDDKVTTLRRQWLQRKNAYKKMKIPIRTRKGKK